MQSCSPNFGGDSCGCKLHSIDTLCQINSHTNISGYVCSVYTVEIRTESQNYVGLQGWPMHMDTNGLGKERVTQYINRYTQLLWSPRCWRWKIPWHPLHCMKPGLINQTPIPQLWMHHNYVTR